MGLETKSLLFEIISEESSKTGVTDWWKKIQPTKSVSSTYTYSRRLQFASDLMLLSVALVIALAVHASLITLLLMEFVFLLTFALLWSARLFSNVFAVIGIYLGVMALAGLVNLVFPGQWGNPYLYNLSLVVLYRFPLSWASALAGWCILILVGTNGILGYWLLPYSAMDITAIAINVLVALIVGAVGWTLRSQYLLMLRLEEVQNQLRLQMLHNEEVAAERERTRIARDIHDVLSHSLAVLSIQVQAARKLVNRDPERLSAKLEDMAQLIRESVTESRQVVGLLRENPSVVNLSQDSDLSSNLQKITTIFKERTGIDCRFKETGQPQPVNSKQKETLQLALREMLTNSHRHGAAQTAWINLKWQPTSLSLEVEDDGKTNQSIASDENSSEISLIAQDKSSSRINIVQEIGGHHGLQGMRERAESLGGEVTIGKSEAGGFLVKISFPRE